MGKREQARSEAAFMRGDTGVDGQATEQETKDVAEIERDKAREQLLRGRTWLGREFLTWLLFASEPGEALVGETVVVFAGRLTLRGVHGDVVELSAKGAMAPYSTQVKRGLGEGLLVHSARLKLTEGDRTWEASLDAEFLDVRSAKLPELLTEADDDRMTERLDLTDQLSAMVDGLLDAFLAVRTSPKWKRDVVPAMRAWMAEGAKSKAPILERARRAAS